MSDIRVKFNAVKNSSNDIKDQSREIRRLVNAVRGCDKALANVPAYGDIHKTLNHLMNQMMDAAAHENTMSAALIHVANFYESAEKAIIAGGNFSKTDIGQLGALGLPGIIGTGFGHITLPKWVQDFINWIKNHGTETTTPKTPAEREHAADLEMKQKAADLRNKERYSEETWRKASVEERKKILEEYMHDVEKILGVDVADKIDWTHTGPSDGKINYGAYSPSENRVRINTYILENYSPSQSYHLMTTITHELRHAYQHQAIEHPENFQVTQETIDSWKESFRTYKEEQAKGYDAYRNIVVEKDARWFAGQD